MKSYEKYFMIYTHPSQVFDLLNEIARLEQTYDVKSKILGWDVYPVANSLILWIVVSLRLAEGKSVFDFLFDLG